MVAGMMNPLFLATRSLNACVRSTRTHSSCLSTELLSHALRVGLLTILQLLYTVKHTRQAGRGLSPLSTVKNPRCRSGALIVSLCSHRLFYLYGTGLEFGRSG